MIIRLVLLLALVFGLMWWFGKGRRRLPERPAAAPPPPAAQAATDALAMVRCAHCGVHLPRDEALADSSGRLFCGEVHRQQGAPGGGDA